MLIVVWLNGVQTAATDYRLTDAKVEPFYNEAENMRNNK